MIVSVFSILVDITFIFLNIKRQKRNNDIIQLVITSIIFLGIALGVIAILLNMVNLPVNLLTETISIGIIDCIFICKEFIYKNIDKKRNIDVRELFGFFICIFFILFISIKRFGLNLNLTYTDVDASRYLKEAMSIVVEQKIQGQFLTNLLIALVIELCQIFLLPINYYKALILSHIIMQIISICMFYILTFRTGGKNSIWWLNTLITIAFWCGFPLCNTVYGTFIQSMNGATIIMYILYYLLDIVQKDSTMYCTDLIFILVGILGLLICYPFYGMIFGPFLLIILSIWLFKNYKFIGKKIFWTFIVAGGIILIIGSIFVGQKVANSLQVFLIKLADEGLTYKNLYMDFIFFIPIIIISLYFLKEKKYFNKLIIFFNINCILFIVIWFDLYLKGFLSSYYYYRMYYILWISLWLLTVEVITILLYLKKDIYPLSYFVLFIVAVLISMFDVDNKIKQFNPNIYFENYDNGTLCPIYKFNYKLMQSDFKTILSNEEFDLYAYVIDNLQDENVVAINSYSTAIQTQWFLGITNADQSVYFNSQDNIEQYGLYTLFHMLDGYHIKYILVEKNDEICMKYYNSIFSNLEVIKENDGGYIYKLNKKYWVDYISCLDGLDINKSEFFEFVNSNYNNSSVPIVCESEQSDNIFQYGIYAGIDTSRYIGIITPENFVECTYMFNKDDIQYLAIIKESEMYKQNIEYFMSQNIIFENSFGIVISYNGGGWMPNE